MFASLLVGVGPQLHRDVRFQPTLGVRVAWDDAVDGWMPLRNPYDLSERDQRLAAKQPDALKGYRQVNEFGVDDWVSAGHVDSP